MVFTSEVPLRISTVPAPAAGVAIAFEALEVLGDDAVTDINELVGLKVNPAPREGLKVGFRVRKLKVPLIVVAFKELTNNCLQRFPELPKSQVFVTEGRRLPPTPS